MSEFNSTQNQTGSGSVYEDAVHATSLRFTKNRVPAVGEIRTFRDGRGFIFCSGANEDFVAGEMVAVQTNLATENTNLIVVSGSYDGAIGSNQIELNSSGLTFFGGGAGVVAVNRLAGGTLHLTGNTGVGYTYGIKANTVGSSSVDIILTLEQALKVAVDATTDCIIAGPKYRYVTEGTAALCPVGSVIVPTTGSTNSREEYFWVQHKGPATVLGSGTVGVTIAAAAGGAVADSVDNDDGTSEESLDIIVGTGLGTSSGEHCAVNLSIMV